LSILREVEEDKTPGMEKRHIPLAIYNDRNIEKEKGYPSYLKSVPIITLDVNSG